MNVGHSDDNLICPSPPSSPHSNLRKEESPTAWHKPKYYRHRPIAKVTPGYNSSGKIIFSF